MNMRRVAVDKQRFDYRLLEPRRLNLQDSIAQAPKARRTLQLLAIWWRKSRSSSSMGVVTGK